MYKPFVVGRTDSKPIPLPGRVYVRRRFRTEKEAAQFIERIATFDPTGVRQGEYYLDGPELSKHQA